MRRFVPSTALGELLLRHREELLAAAERRHAGDVRVFGSLTRGDDHLGSDVDLLVTVREGGRPLEILSLACDLEEILGVHVEVGTLESLRPEIRATIDRDAVLL